MAKDRVGLLNGLIIAVVVCFTLVLFSTPAHAASCPMGGSETDTSPVATTSFDWQLCGSNHEVIVRNGVLHDVLCDSRQGSVDFSIQFETTGGHVWETMAGSKQYYVSTGCGNSASYPTITLIPSSSPGGDCASCNHRLQVHLLACNNGIPACSGDYISNISYWY